MDRVTVEERDGSVRIHVNLNRDRGTTIGFGILILIPTASVIPLVSNLEWVSLLWPFTVICIICSAGVLLLWLVLGYHKQTISVTRLGGAIENLNVYGLIKKSWHHKLEEVLDIVEDSKRAEKTGQKYFIWMPCKGGKRILLTRPSIYIDKEQVDKIYDALRPHIGKPLDIVDRAYFQHVTVSKGESGLIIVFSPRLHFISVRYHAILITMVSFLAFPFVLFAILIPTEFLSMSIYPGTAFEGLVLMLFLPVLIPWRKKHLAHNRTTTTLTIHTSSQTVGVVASVNGIKHVYTDIPFENIKQITTIRKYEPTFASTVSEHTSYYLISLKMDVTPSRFNTKNPSIGRMDLPDVTDLISLYETESHAEAWRVEKFLVAVLLSKE